MMKTAALRADACSADLGQCSLKGIAPISVTLPKRLECANPLAVKWDQLLKNDRCKGWFSPDLLSGTSIDEIQTSDDGSGTYKLFHRDGIPIAGIFHKPSIGPEAFAVYGGIFAAYNGRGHCNGPLGFPKSDEETLTFGSGPMGTGFDGQDRVNYFEHGLLWWDAQTLVVSDKKPKNLIEIMSTHMEPSQFGQSHVNKVNWNVITHK